VHEIKHDGFRVIDPLQAVEAAFKATTTKPPEPAPKSPSLPNVKELVSLRIDRDVLEHFQEGVRDGKTGSTRP
jgi:uncharacterized protein (DUF4415 family)